MTKEELMDKMITGVMEEFDFDKVRKVMLSLDWKWNIGNGEMTVPSTYRLTKQAEKLLKDAASYYGKRDFYFCGCGGFVASLDGKDLSLQFILAETTTYAGDYED